MAGLGWTRPSRLLCGCSRPEITLDPRHQSDTPEPRSGGGRVCLAIMELLRTCGARRLGSACERP